MAENAIRVALSGQTLPGLARIRIERPPVNVLRIADLEDLAAAVSGVASARVLLLTGLPRAFSAGVEVAEHAPEPAAIDRMLAAMRAVLSALVATPAVTIAAVSGACLGGGAEIVAACDLVYVAEDARIGFPEIRLACFPPAGSALLPLRLAHSRATDWILSGRTVSGREAAAAGFAARAFSAETVEPEAERAAEELLGRSPAALAASLFVLRAALRETLGPEGALARAEEAYRGLAGNADLARAIRMWKGRA